MQRNHEALRAAGALLPHREHLPRAYEVEFFDLGEDEYSEGHVAPRAGWEGRRLRFSGGAHTPSAAAV